jgi:hypothetical protein
VSARDATIKAMLRDWNPLVRWILAGVASGVICTAACLFLGFFVPTWIFGRDTPDSPYTGQIFSVTLSFASAYSVLGFILLTIFFYRRMSGSGGS